MAKFLFPVVAVALFISFFRLGSVTLFDVDEAVFAEATKEMVESGDWITPTYNGENRYDKPILFYWLMAISYKTFGISEFSTRFPSALSALIVSLALFFFVRHFLGKKKAFYATIPLLLSPYFLVYSHAAVTDMALTLFITISLFSFYLSTACKGAPPGRNFSFRKENVYIYGFYIFSALAFLTKGLIGILFPFGIAIIFLLSTEGLNGIKRAFNTKGIIFFLILSMPWYVSQLFINGQEFVQQFFIKHHFMRYTGIISGHKGPIYYYIPALLIGSLPWIGFLPGGIRSALKGREQNSSLVTCAASGGSAEADRSSVNLFALIWFAFIFIFFSLSATKLPNYILPAAPAVSILISSGMTERDKLARYANAFIAVIVALTGIAFLISKKYLLRFGFYNTDWILAIAAVLFITAIMILYAALTKKTLYGVLSILMLVFLSLLSIKAVPMVNQYLQGTLYRYSVYAKNRLHDGEKIITFGINNPSILFYSGHKLMTTGNQNELMPLLQQGKRLLVISKAKEIEILNKLGFNVLEEDGRYAILEKR